jgi:hypothetical protein
MPRLPLAIDIADTITNHRRDTPLDVEAKSDRLFQAHPESDASLSDIADALREEGAAVGLMSVDEAEG